jgi:predicted ABC-type ATPase
MSGMRSSPHILVYAGPNGSGKSTITKSRDIVGVYINADEIKKIKRGSDLDAAKEAEHLRELCLSESKDFTFETVLSTPRNLELLGRAKTAGYYIESVFVITANEELNVFRVKSRMADGGHDVPDDKIRSRYHKALANLHEFVHLSDVCVVIDNTIAPEIIFIKDESGERIAPNKFWSEDVILKWV